jgi:hypothetical protein
MTRSPKTVRPDQLVSEALEVLNSMKITALFAVEVNARSGSCISTTCCGQAPPEYDATRLTISQRVTFPVRPRASDPVREKPGFPLARERAESEATQSHLITL